MKFLEVKKILEGKNQKEIEDCREVLAGNVKNMIEHYNSKNYNLNPIFASTYGGLNELLINDQSNLETCKFHEKILDEFVIPNNIQVFRNIDEIAVNDFAVFRIKDHNATYVVLSITNKQFKIKLYSNNGYDNNPPITINRKNCNFIIGVHNNKKLIFFFYV